MLIRILVAAIGVMLMSSAAADIPRTPDGKPDLQGVWANTNATPLERPAQLADIDELSDEQLAEFLAKRDALFDGGGEAAFGDDVYNSILADAEEHESYDPTTGNYNQFWVEERAFEKRTSLIVDPPNGRKPPLTPEAQARAEAHAAYVAAHPADSYTDRINSDRCITFGVPFIAAGYNGYFQIAQTPDTVAIMQEMAHEVRVVPLDDTPPLDDSVQQWIGSSRGWWEGDELVVETKNFSTQSTFFESSENLHLTERFRRLDADTLQWEIRVEDPTTWTAPWTMVINMHRSDAPIFEYACHEGNIAMEGILAGARAEEEEAAAAAAARTSGGEE